MRRRRFIALGATGLAIYGAGIATGIWLDPASDSNTAPSANQLEDFARSLQGVAEAGRAWISSHPDRNPGNDLLQDLNLKPAEPLSRADLIDHVAGQIKKDFEHSRLFKHDSWWLSETEARLAALHVALLGNQASEAQKPGFEQAPEVSLVALQRFEPEQVVQGESIRHPNLPDNVLYFALDHSPPPRYVVYLGEHRLTINSSENGFSIRIPDPVRYALFEQPDESPVWLYDPVTNQRQRLGAFTVLTAAVDSATQDFCPIKAWGPQTTSAGSPFNEQPDGASALWIRTNCFPEQTVVAIGGQRVKTTLRVADGLITTHITDHSIYSQPGDLAVELIDTVTDKRQRVGILSVQPAGE